MITDLKVHAYPKSNASVMGKLLFEKYKRSQEVRGDSQSCINVVINSSIYLFLLQCVLLHSNQQIEIRKMTYVKDLEKQICVYVKIYYKCMLSKSKFKTCIGTGKLSQWLKLSMYELKSMSSDPHGLRRNLSCIVVYQ